MNLTAIIPAFGLRTFVHHLPIEVRLRNCPVMHLGTMPVFCLVSFDRHSTRQRTAIFSLC